MFSRRWGGGLKMKRGPGTILYWDLRWGFFGFLAKTRKSAVFPPPAARGLLGPFSGVSGVSRGFSPKPPQTPKTTPKPSKPPCGRFRGFQGFLGVLAQNPPKPPKLPPSLPKSSQSPVQTLADFGRLSQDFDKPATDFATSLQHVAQSAPNLHNMLHILHNMLHKSCRLCTNLHNMSAHVVQLLHNIHNTTHIISNATTSYAQDLYTCAQSAQWILLKENILAVWSASNHGHLASHVQKPRRQSLDF